MTATSSSRQRRRSTAWTGAPGRTRLTVAASPGRRGGRRGRRRASYLSQPRLDGLDLGGVLDLGAALADVEYVGGTTCARRDLRVVDVEAERRELVGEVVEEAHAVLDADVD